MRQSGVVSVAWQSSSEAASVVFVFLFFIYMCVYKCCVQLLIKLPTNTTQEHNVSKVVFMKSQRVEWRSVWRQRRRRRRPLTWRRFALTGPPPPPRSPPRLWPLEAHRCPGLLRRCPARCATFCWDPRYGSGHLLAGARHVLNQGCFATYINI